MSIATLTMMIYFLISSGPYGIEEVVQSGGLFYAPIFIVMLPLVLSFP